MATVAMPSVDALREKFPEAAKDIKVNVSSLASSEIFDAEQIWGVALASAYYLGEPSLSRALLSDAKAAGASEALLEDAQAAATLMGMNTVYFRFRHLVHKEVYGQKPARLRMQWMARPKTSKALFELMSLAIAALAGCEVCVKAHEASVQQHGLGEDHVHEAARVASILYGAKVALQLP
ncbi:MAG: carboxymuconolactone decarboxylase family protein [Planctomycetota bacterium]|jgi:alkyl hydroperoxide reductase subunit D